MTRITFKSIPTVLIVIALCSSCFSEDSIWACNEGEYVEYKPIFGDSTGRSSSIEEMYMIDESRVDAEHYENIKFVFDYHRIKYKVENGKVTVDCAVWKDIVAMANYTREANDRNWLQRSRLDLRGVRTESGIELQVIDRMTGAIKIEIKVPFKGLGWFSHDGRRVIWEEYRPVTENKKIIIFDSETGTPIGKATVEKDAWAMDITPDDKQLTYQLSDEKHNIIHKTIDLEPVPTNP
jgi:hypothetical protein